MKRVHKAMSQAKYSPLAVEHLCSKTCASATATQRQRHRYQHLVTAVFLGFVCLAEGIALIWLLVRSTDLECFPTTIVFQSTGMRMNESSEADVDRAWSSYGLRE